MSEARLFAAAPGRPFTDDLAQGLLARTQDSVDLAEHVVLVDRPATATALARALAEAAGGASLLPQIHTLSSESLGALLTRDAPGAAPPPAASVFRRHLALMDGLLDLDPQIARLIAPSAPSAASDLARLLGEAAASDSPPEGLVGDAAARTEAWRTVWPALFLAARAWPAALAAEGLLDPDARRRALVHALAAAPGARWIFAATPRDALEIRLAAAAARTRGGAAVAPMFDAAAASLGADALGEAHPCAPTARLLAALDLDAAAVRPWAPAPAPRPERARLWRAAFTPERAARLWRAQADALGPDAARAAETMTLLEAKTPREEGEALAIALREALETPAARAALVTPDAALAARAARALSEMGVLADAPPAPLSESAPGAFFLRVAAAADPAAADALDAPLLALLKHPLCVAARDRSEHLALTRRLEADILRARRPSPGLAGVAREIEAAARDPKARRETLDLEPGESDVEAERGDQFLLDLGGALTPGPKEAPAPPALGPWFERVAAALAPLADALAGEASFAERLAGHRAAALALTTPHAADAAPELFTGAAGAALEERLRRLEAEARPARASAPGAAYLALIAETLAASAAPPRPEAPAPHARLVIARPEDLPALRADVVALGGLVAGAWPASPSAGPWLSRTMRAEIGLAPPERALGPAAAGFLAGALAPRVVLSRALAQDRAPTTPSPWLLRLETMLKAAAPDALAAMRARGARCLERARQWRDGPADAARPSAAPRPRPAPPVAARPTDYVATEIRKLIADPYAIYAKKILRLRPRPDLGDDPGPRERGELFHKVLESYVKKTMGAEPAELARREAYFDAAMERALAPLAPWPGRQAIWRAQLERLRPRFLADEAERRRASAPAAVEIHGALLFETALGETTIAAEADRIDRVAGGYAIYDYKTGEPPKPAALEAYDKQLQLEAAILKGGGFDRLAPGRVVKLAHIALAAPANKPFESPLDGDAQALADEALAGLKALLSRYADPNQAYEARLRPEDLAFDGDYDHLARLDEWRDDAED